MYPRRRAPAIVGVGVAGIDPERYSLVFHWHRTNLLVTEGTRETLGAILHEQCASTVQ